MEIQVSGALSFRKLLGDDHPLRLEIESGTTIEGLLGILGAMLGEPFTRLVFASGSGGRIKNTVLFLLNGTPHWNLPERLATTLQHGDTLRLTPMMTGG
jgi:hypothetical protein